ncbi:hypothetical protein TRIATDRAFT_93396 [Trichoderma atroviride IMI 206040]|uniref:Uncharacterized protein n=1 Tax=Hypocrea atroviridis (strain ATCC 20476 / IMI 206040) TaxID=452589 RepID=G9NFK3_HYPAI|nr:uncharacterized protein TRIATDRAFT_93396 [Trichoderma atroviride IMI 206040]EHK50718.1 hypothetical protein TRIATDRAFT_93396 [Trichoderma atroviride IMI 206040]
MAGDGASGWDGCCGGRLQSVLQGLVLHMAWAWTWRRYARRRGEGFEMEMEMEMAMAMAMDARHSAAGIFRSRGLQNASLGSETMEMDDGGAAQVTPDEPLQEVAGEQTKRHKVKQEGDAAEYTAAWPGVA